MSNVKAVSLGRVAAFGILAAILLLSLFVVDSASADKGKEGHVAPAGSIAIDNGIIDIDDFGETWSGVDVWLYPAGVSNAYYEEPYLSYGWYSPVGLTSGTVLASYPATGVPDVWYHATIDVDLDGDTFYDVRVTRSIMVPSGQKLFRVRYVFQNISGSALPNFRFFQGVDYDVAYYGGDEGGYDKCGFVWEHDLDDGYFTWVGFKGNVPPDHHSVDRGDNMWNQLSTGVLNDADYYEGDTGVALEWDFGSLDTLAVGASRQLTVTFAFADTYDELSSLLCPPPQPPQPPSVPSISQWGMIGMVGLLGACLIWAVRRKRVAKG